MFKKVLLFYKCFRDLGKLNEVKLHFENLSSSLTDALSKKAAINKHKTQEIQDATNSLTAVGTCFAHNSLDYVAHLNLTHARKNLIMIDAVSGLFF